MADADAVIHVAQAELEELVGQDTGCVGKPKERVVGEDGPQPHSPRMENGLVTQVAQAAMAVDNLDALADDNVPKDGEEGEDGGEGGVAVDDEEGDVVDFEAVGEVADALAIVVGVGYDDDLVAAVDKLAGELVDVGFDAAGLGEEKVADHGDVVRLARHLGGGDAVLGSGFDGGGVRQNDDCIVCLSDRPLSCSSSEVVSGPSPLGCCRGSPHPTAPRWYGGLWSGVWRG